MGWILLLLQTKNIKDIIKNQYVLLTSLLEKFLRASMNIFRFLPIQKFFNLAFRFSKIYFFLGLFTWRTKINRGKRDIFRNILLHPIAIFKTCQEYSVLFVLDEAQTSNSRNGLLSIKEVSLIYRTNPRHNEIHEVITCSPDCTSTSYTSWSKRNKRNSPTASTASTYAFPTNYRFIVRSFSLLHEPVLSHRPRDVCRMVLCSRKTFIDARVAKLCGLCVWRT